MADIWNLNALCRCCHKDGYFRSMQYPYVGQDGDVEVYSIWLKEVFDIKMVTPSVAASEMICEECITRLRDARTFKKQVTDCELRFQQYCRNETVVVKVELETDENTHSESDSKILQDFDVINSSPLKKHEDHKSTIKIEMGNDLCDNDNTDNIDNTDNLDNSDDCISDSEPLAKKDNGKKGKRKVSNVETITWAEDSSVAKRNTIKTEATSTMTKMITINPTKQPDLATNTESNLWSCKLCGETKKNIIDLQKHMAKKHRDGNEFEDIKCQFCDDVVKGHDMYKQHIRTSHPDKGTVCNFCPEVFLYRAHLRDHYEQCHNKDSGKRPRLYLRDHCDPFTKYSDVEFHSRYGFTPHAVKNMLLPMLEEDLRRPSMRGLPFAPEIMILVALRFYATGSIQKLDEDTISISQQSLSRIVANVSTLFAGKMKDVVKFPSTAEEINSLKLKFYEMAGFPGVIGCIDCTHIKIKSPGGITSEVYRNRKGTHSINVQAIAGPNLQLLDLVARWPGSSQDSFIYDSSVIKRRLETGELQGVLLGDNGYAVSNVLLTPFVSPGTNSQEEYNKSHIKTRSTVHRLFAVWKRKFPCLQVGMGVKLNTAVAVICACATLYNIAISVDDVGMEVYTDDDIDAESNDVTVTENPNSDGFIARQSLVDRFFS